ncbi:ATP-binding protein [Rhodopila sp.]|uniref:ATP-binding protein n=1 Tax=Rhodopila sp. TaxID=2480087 RepID=UPI002BC8EC6A|nr:ATP-binding protein [Rhodopila sp.]HVZ09418.1 ATP-binding protein [Rhodopila sp.]
MKLSTRLFVVAFVCLIPVVAALTYLQSSLRAHREETLGNVVLNQTMVAAGATSAVIRSVGDLAVSIAPLADPAASPEACRDQLAGLTDRLGRYRFLALYTPDGKLVCGSDSAPGRWRADDLAWFHQIAAASSTETGVTETGVLGRDTAGQPVLPVGAPVGPSQPGRQPLILVAGLDPAWLAEHLKEVRQSLPGSTGLPEILVADRAGSVVASLPGASLPGANPSSANPSGGQASRTTALPAWLRPLLSRRTAAAEAQTAPDGAAVMVAYIPTGPADAGGLPVFGTVPVATDLAASAQASWPESIVRAVAIIAALLLAWLAGNRLIRKPVLGLLQADRRWRQGDLSARVKPARGTSEFATLAHAFNTMADALQVRDAESQRQATALEARVEERTRALSESNNRLQVEIAGREKAAAALHQAQKLQAVGQLAGGIAHDFNNVLATVLGNLELIERRLNQVDKPWVDADRERVSRLVDRASSAVHRGSRLTSRLLAFSRRQQISPTPTDINALLRDAVTLAGSALGSRIKVVSEMDESLWPALVDPSQVEAAILNLCFNARDALPGGGTVTIRTTNTTIRQDEDLQAPAGDYVAISVSDTGSGMTADVKARAFEPFFTTKGLVGTGLGLSQVYGMARQAGGDVTIRSQPDEGTTVTLYLPRSQAAHNDNDGAIADAEVSVAERGEYALVVDDDRDVRQVTVEMLRDLGFDVTEAPGALQALELIGSLPRQPDLILVDYAMPGMNGLRLAEEMRQRGVTAPIGLVTGYAELSGADLTAARFFGVLQKPFTIEGLQGLVAQRRRAMDAVQVDAVSHLI